MKLSRTISSAFVCTVCAFACGSSVARDFAALLDAERTREYAELDEAIRAFAPESGAYQRLRREALNESALIVPGDRDPLDVVLRRTKALLYDLLAMENAPDLASEAQALARLTERSAWVSSGDILFKETCALRRKIAFANPLLDFGQILFLKHDRAYLFCLRAAGRFPALWHKARPDVHAAQHARGWARDHADRAAGDAQRVDQRGHQRLRAIAG